MRTVNGFLGASKINGLDTPCLLLRRSRKRRALGCCYNRSGRKSRNKGAFLNGWGADFLLGSSPQRAHEGLGSHCVYGGERSPRRNGNVGYLSQERIWGNLFFWVASHTAHGTNMQHPARRQQQQLFGCSAVSLSSVSRDSIRQRRQSWLRQRADGLGGAVVSPADEGPSVLDSYAKPLPPCRLGFGCLKVPAVPEEIIWHCSVWA